MRTDVIIVGGGIAGASAAYFLSADRSVTLVEREAGFGHHSSGRSAAQFTLGITADTMRRMGRASRDFLEAPPAGFADYPLLAPRGCLTVARADQEDALARLAARLASVGAQAERLSGDEAVQCFPALVPDRVGAGLLEPDAMDIDVDALLQGYMRGAKARGATLIGGAAPTAIRRDGGDWVVTLPDRELRAPALVNAAGAWVDEVARLAGIRPIGIEPRRRTAFTFALQSGFDTRQWPHVGSVDYDWYVKPEPGCLMGSLSDATPAEPGDVYPEDIDLAQAIANIEDATRLKVGRPLSTWAGLRSFVSDRNPVAGSRPGEEGFFFLAGQGGCGILTSPAMGLAIAASVNGRNLPEELRAAGLGASDLSPAREALRA